MFTKLMDNNDIYHYFKRGDTLIVAVSGGPDSVALLHILNSVKEKWDLSLIAAHVDHQLRAEESRADASFVKELADSLAIPCEIGIVDVEAFKQAHGVGTQAAARELRYAFLLETAKKYNADAIATAHHMNDQAETVLLRMIRGTSTTGLAGIPPVRTENGFRIVRPFLPFITRADIEQYMDDNKLASRLDQSNESRKYLRNRVRLDILPLLRTLNPRIDEHLAQLAETARTEHRYLEEQAKKNLDSCVIRHDDGRIEIDRHLFLASDVALQRRMITLILNYLTLSDENSFLHIEQIRQMMGSEEPSSAYPYVHPLRIFNDYERTIFTTENEGANTSFRHSVVIPGITAVVERGKQLRTIITDIPLRETENNGDWAFFDFAVFEEGDGDWEIRSRLPGDRMKVQGLSGTKKVKDILIDDKVSREKRDGYPVLTFKDEIMWVPGLRRSDYGKVSKETSTYIYFFWEDTER